MRSVETHGSFEAAISDSSAKVQAIARRLRQTIIAAYPDVVEVPWPKQRIIGYGVGPKKMSEHFCYIGAQKDYVNLGFYYGADLPDPEDLLEGTGKKLRHIKLRDVEAANRTSVQYLIRLALEERKESLGLDG